MAKYKSKFGVMPTMQYPVIAKNGSALAGAYNTSEYNYSAPTHTYGGQVVQPSQDINQVMSSASHTTPMSEWGGVTPSAVATSNVDAPASHGFNMSDVFGGRGELTDAIRNNPVAYAEWQKAPTTGMNAMSAIGTGTSALSGLYGMYSTYQNNKNQEKQYKDSRDLQMKTIASNDANRSAMAKAFGSTYTPTLG